MCVTDHHDMTLAVKVPLNPKTTNQVITLESSNMNGAIVRISVRAHVIICKNKDTTDWDSKHIRLVKTP